MILSLAPYCGVVCARPLTDRHAAGLESELRALRQQQSDAGAAQVKVQQDLDVAKAEVARLQGQLGAAGRLQGQLDDLRSQLAQAAQRETALQQQKAAAEQEAQHKAAQVRWTARAPGTRFVGPATFAVCVADVMDMLQIQDMRGPAVFCRHQLHPVHRLLFYPRRMLTCACAPCPVLQLATAQQSVERLQQQVTAGQPELEGLRSRVQQLDRELQEAKVRQIQGAVAAHGQSMCPQGTMS